MQGRYRCYMPILSLLIKQRKGETNKAYAKRFEMMMTRHNNITWLRIKLKEKVGG